jgi:predicted glycogen debranching enzyme
MICNATNAEWVDDPRWYRNFHYTLEQERGLDDREDLVSPGKMRWDFGSDQAVWILGTEPAVSALAASTDLLGEAETIVRGERRRRGQFADPLARAADAYLVQRGVGKTIVAGYPWFTDWGRDTFIALRGLCLTAGRWREAGDILLEWASTVSEGMLPNRFPDGSDPPEYNAVDASLWYIIASSELLVLTASSDILSAHDRHRLESVMLSVLEGLARGTRYGIRCDMDGLLACGVAGVQLTWMDARVGDRVITPRIGKPVEIQALWINALAAGARLSSGWPAFLKHARQSFDERFWNEPTGCLFDVIDVDHVEGATDDSIRPNQIFAVGGLPIPVLDGIRARSVVDAVESHLLTPLGLRTLSPQSSAYIGRYQGNPSSRDAAYHQGTAWPWLMGAFVDAWIRTHGDEPGLIEEARTRFLGPLIAHLEDAGLGHLSEIVDGDAPHAPRGCPFQAWSLGELLRIRQALTDVVQRA